MKEGIKRSAWLQLIRLPNLLTVPGDPLAGFLLACGAAGVFPWARGAAAMLAALCLYAFGLVLNDWADCEEDRRERPGRPLPSGRVSRGAALALAAGLALAGLGAAFAGGAACGLTALALVVMVAAYDLGLKSVPGAGPLAMGACRGLSLAMGAAASGAESWATAVVLAAAAGLTLYVAAVTLVASRETETLRVGLRRWAPASVLAVLFVWAMAARVSGSWFFVVLAAAAVGWAALQGRRLAGTPGPAVVGRSVGGWIRGLLLIQAAFVSTIPVWGWAPAAGLLLLWPVNVWLGRSFYAT